jgi:lipoate-protein ligase A
MPIESFYEMMEIDTDEKVEALIKAFEAAERRGPYVPKHDIMKELEEGEKYIKRKWGTPE